MSRAGDMPSSRRRNSERVLSSNRMTVFSPQIVDVVETRTSTCAAVDGHLELAVLRTPPLDDVHVGHDLDAADERRAHVGRQRQHLVQRAVDAEADAHLLVGRLDVHVRRTVAQRLGDDLVDDLDDGRVVDDRGGGGRLLWAASIETSLSLNASMSVLTSESAW